MQRIVFLNVPARQSKGYFDYLNSNIPHDNVVFVDALFGGLDVAARVKWFDDASENYMIDIIKRLIIGNRPDEATIAKVNPFYEKNNSSTTRENFIIVISQYQQNMNELAHQNSLTEFMKRTGIQKKLRFAGVVTDFEEIEQIAFPFYLNADFRNSASDGRVTICEFSLSHIDDPRSIIMDRLQQFPGIESTRTFFGVNYGNEVTIKPNSIQNLWVFAKEWAQPLLAWRRLLGM